MATIESPSTKRLKIPKYLACNWPFKRARISIWMEKPTTTTSLEQTLITIPKWSSTPVINLYDHLIVLGFISYWTSSIWFRKRNILCHLYNNLFNPHLAWISRVHIKIKLERLFGRRIWLRLSAPFILSYRLNCCTFFHD